MVARRTSPSNVKPIDTDDPADVGVTDLLEAARTAGAARWTDKRRRASHRGRTFPTWPALWLPSYARRHRAGACGGALACRFASPAPSRGGRDSRPAGQAGHRCKACRASRRRLDRTLDGIKRSKPPTPKRLDGEQEAKVIATRLGPPPAGYANGSLRLLACKVVELSIVESISHETVRRTLKKTA